MEWWLYIVILFGSTMIVMATGMPVAFCFMLINVVGMYIFLGGMAGLEQFILSMYTSVAVFTMLPVPLFILMGELLFKSGTGMLVINALDGWFGKLRGRLSLVTVVAGTILAALTGSSVSSTSMMGSVMIPEMTKQGYKRAMVIGPILAAGGLAPMIPPSNLAILVGAIGEIEIGKLLIAIIGPGVLMAVLFGLYVIIRCRIDPSLAPAYELEPAPFSVKLKNTVLYIMPMGIVIFLVIGVMMLGLATATEAAATGCFGTFIMAVIYKKMSWKVMKDCVVDTLKISGMILLIISCSRGFAQIVTFTGGGNGLTQLAANSTFPAMLGVIAMMLVILVMGCFMSYVAIMMLTLPIFIPIIRTWGLDPIWFGSITLINMELAFLTPPFGMNLYVLKGVAPPDYTMNDIIRGVIPIIGLNLLAIAIIMIFPKIALWLPSVAR